MFERHGPPAKTRRAGWLWPLIGVLALIFAMYLGFIFWLYGSDKVDMARATNDAFRSGGVATAIPLRRNVYLLTGGEINAVALIGPDSVLLVDTGTNWAAPKLADALRGVTDLPVGIIINTHAHTDHRGGNGFFGQGKAEIIAQTVTADMMRDGLATITATEDMPTRVFATNDTFQFGGETVIVTHIPDAHTQGDAVVRFVQADVFATGDIFVNEGFPYIAEPVGASIDGYLRAQTAIMGMVGAQTIVVPGHGPKADLARLHEVNDRLTRIRNKVVFWKRLGLPPKFVLLTYPTSPWPLSWAGIGVSPKFFTQLVYRTESGGQ